jgi:hypothetical protein
MNDKFERGRYPPDIEQHMKIRKRANGFFVCFVVGILYVQFVSFT